MPNSIRVGVTPNKGAKKPTASTIFLLKLPTTYKALAQACKSKLKIKSKAARLFVSRGGGVGVCGTDATGSGAGFEITPNVNVVDLNQKILCHGILICVSDKGADYNDGSGGGGSLVAGTKSTNKEEPLSLEYTKIVSKLSKPPRCAFDPLLVAKTSTNMDTKNGNDDPALVSDDNGSDGNISNTVNAKDTSNKKIHEDVERDVYTLNKECGSSMDAYLDEKSGRRSSSVSKVCVPLNSYELNGAFPVIPNDADMRCIMRDTISLGNASGSGRVNHHTTTKTKAKPSSLVSGLGIFQEVHREGFIVYDYRGKGNISPEFPNPLPTNHKVSRKERYERALLRECRGLILCAQSGRVLARRFHKFFNVDENEECQLEVVRGKILSDAQQQRNHSANSDADDHYSVAVCFEKIDGCLCSPVLVPAIGESIIWATRRTRSPEIEEYVESMKGKIDYNGLCLFAFKNLDATPLFEWCPSSHVIAVVKHVEASLKFLAFRSNVSGAYFDMDVAAKKLHDHYKHLLQVMESIPKAEKVCAARNLNLFCSDVDKGKGGIVDVKNWGQGREGVVIAFSDGTRYKLKSDWYVTMAKASKIGGTKNFLPHFLKLLREKKNSLTLDQIPVDKIWLSALYDVDDVIAACVSQLRHFHISSDESLDPSHLFLRFIRSVRKAIKHLVSDLQSWAKDSFDICGNMHVISNFAYQQFGWPPDLVRSSLQSCLHEGSKFDKSEVPSILSEQMKNFLLSIAKDSDKGVERLTRILGVKWYFEKDDVSNFLAHYHIPEDEILPSSFADFVPCPAAPTKDAIQKHVLEKYAPKKIEMLMGKQNPSFIYIPQKYQEDEGRIKGFWEQFQRYGVLDLRVDLQPMTKNGPTAHEGSKEYATFLVQFGLGPNKKVNSTGQRRGNLTEYSKGDVAGVLLPTQTPVSVTHFIEALTTSFKMRRMVRMQRRCVLLEGELLGGNSAGIHNQVPSFERFTFPTSSNELIPLSNTSKNNINWTLYCDLDGVLADFEKGVQNVTGTSPNEQQLDKMWRKVLNQSKFFAHLDFMPGAELMWVEICKIFRRLYGDNASSNLKILTGLPMTYKNQVRKDKKSWCVKNLFPIAGSPIDVITCQSKNKQEYSFPGRILIDDSGERKKDWAMHGGVLIHHFSNARTLYELRRTVGLLEEWIEDEFSLVLPIDGNNLKEGMADDQMISYKWVNGDDIPFNVSDHQFVGFDCEWGIHTSLVQMAVLSNEKEIEVYLIDMLNAGPHLLNFVHNDICCNERITKIGFALESDATQLQVQLKNAVDLQEVATDLMNSQNWSVKGSNLGFGEMVQQVLGIVIPKEKNLQNSNWEARPLTEAQMQYAAADSFYSLKMYIHIVHTIRSLTLVDRPEVVESRIIPPKLFTPRRDLLKRSNRSKKVAAADDDWAFPQGTVVFPIFAGAFLSPASKQELIQNFKPQYKNTVADHVTFCANFDTAYLRRILPLIGSTCKVGIENYAYVTSPENSGMEVDCVRVKSIVLDDTKESLLPMITSGYPHITLSTGINTQARASLDLIEDTEGMKTISISKEDEGNIIYIRASIGLVVTEKDDQLVGLSKKVKNQIHDFMSNKWVMGEQLRFAPGELSSAERSTIHLFAEGNNLESRSEGNKSRRKLILVKKRQMSLETSEPNSKVPKSPISEDEGFEERVFKCGNEAIDKKLESRSFGNEKKTKRITDQYRCTKIYYDLGSGEVVNGSIFETRNIPDLQQSNDPLAGIYIDTSGTCKIKWYQDKSHSLVEADIVIMRGLPGSGKSSLSGSIEIRGDPKTSVICSADHYFENGAGLNNREKKRLIAEGVDIYDHVFSTDKLGLAHQFCWETFQEAMRDMIDEKVKRIILDNTNSCKWEYQKYMQAATENDMKVVIVEVKCYSPSQVSTFCRRSRHSVPQKVSHAMFGRWEKDERALIFESLGIEENNINMDSVKSLPLPGITYRDKTIANWMSENHMFHFSKSRSDTTHLQMAVGTRPATFISVGNMRKEFLLRYANDDSSKYIHEMIGSDVDKRFRMFLDVDFSFDRCMTRGELKTLMLAAQQCAASQSIVIATGIDEEILSESKDWKKAGNDHLKRTGLHIRLPQTYLNRNEALIFCKNLVMLLNNKIPIIDWTKAVDTEVYGPSGGLRMFLSKKVTKGEDKGRIYDIITTLLTTEEGARQASQEKTGGGKMVWGRIPEELAPTLEEVIELCSIHKYL